jgi:PD-(D/E)XK nuclease superfamily protein
MSTSTATAIKGHQDRAVEVAQQAIYALTLVDALKAICDGWRAEAVSLEGAKQRGAIGRQKELRTGASLLMAVALKVGELAPTKQVAPVAEGGLFTDAVAGTAQRIDDVIAKHHPDPVAAAHETVAKMGPPLFPTATGTALAASTAPGSAAAYISGQTDTYEPNGAQSVQILNPGELPAAAQPVNVTTDLRPQQSDPSVPVQLTPAGQVVPFVEAPEFDESVRDGVVVRYVEQAPPGATVLNLVDPGSIYTPPPRLPWSRIPQLWDEIKPLDHTSYSQITSSEDCSLKYLLNRAARSKVIPGGRPQWATLAGNAYHSAIEMIERDPDHGYTIANLPEWWASILESAAAEHEATTGIGRSQWRISNSGLENEDWWRVEGAKMVKLYIDAHTPELRAKTQILQLSAGPDQPSIPLLEYATSLEVAGTRIDLIIDQAWLDPAETNGAPFALRDLKSGAKDPFDTFQLAIYQHALSRQWGQPVERFSGAYWNARKGINTTAVNAAKLHPWEEIEYRVAQAQQAQAARLAQPRVSSFCHGCEFKAQCPAVVGL